MTHRHSVFPALAVPAFAAILALAAGGTAVLVQGPAVIGTGPISHIAVSTSDVEATARQIAAVFDFPVPTVNSNNRLAQPPEGAETAVAKAATVFFPNFLLEIQSSATDFGPIFDTVKNYGPLTVHHISFGVKNDAYRATRDQLVTKGGNGSWRGGTWTTTWSYVDFRESMGFTFEPISQQIYDMLDGRRAKTVEENRKTAAVEPGNTLGTQPVTKVGIVVRNIDAASKLYADVLGVTIPPARDVKQMEFPAGSKANPKAYIRTTSWMHANNVAIELIEPVGAPSPWADYMAKQKGNAVHHLTFKVGDKLPALIKLGQQKGGVVTYGRPGGNTAYLDFTEKIGFVVALEK